MITKNSTCLKMHLATRCNDNVALKFRVQSNLIFQKQNIYTLECATGLEKNTLFLW